MTTDLIRFPDKVSSQTRMRRVSIDCRPPTSLTNRCKKTLQTFQKEKETLLHLERTPWSIETPFKMPSVALHPRPNPTNKPLDNPLPELLQTPSGLAILELQGTINFPSPEAQEGEEQDGRPAADSEQPSSATDPATFETPLGKLMFPDYSPQNNKDDTSWMKRVYLYVGRYQRIVGQVKKLAQPIAVVQRRQQDGAGETDELEILEIVRHKILFGSRPEPVNDN